MEDGAVLGSILANIQSKDDVPARMRLWERLRKDRSEKIARETFAQV